MYSRIIPKKKKKYNSAYIFIVYCYTYILKVSFPFFRDVRPSTIAELKRPLVILF